MNRRGIALLVVVVIIALLSLAGYAFVALTSSELNAARQRGRDIQIQYAVQSGVSLVEATAMQSELERQKLGGTYDNPRLFCAVSTSDNPLDSQSQPHLTIIAPRIKNGQFAGIRYGLVNESAKLHLAKILEWETANSGDGVKALQHLPGMTVQTAEAILDWIDADNRQRTSGAEAAYYTRRRLPYRPRNAVPATLEEFLLVRGVTRRLMFGNDENFNFVNDFYEKPSTPQHSGETPAVAWSYLLTVIGAERDANPEGRVRIDLNESNLEFLHTQLKSRVNAEIADFVVWYRQYGATTAQDDTTTSTIGATSRIRRSRSARTNSQAAARTNRMRNSAAQPKPDFQIPARFRLETPLDIVNVSVSIPAASINSTTSTITSASANSETTTPTNAEIPTNQAIESPLIVNASSLNSTLLTYLDEVSTSSDTTIVGRININEAPYEVIAAIPNLPQNAARQIVDRREQPANGMRDMYRHPTWLLAFDIVDLETLKKIWRDVACGGDVFHAQIVSFYEDTGMFSRVETAIDATIYPPRQVERRDLTSYGIGFHDRVLFGNIPRRENNAFGTDGELIQPTAPTLADALGASGSIADRSGASHLADQLMNPYSQTPPQESFSSQSFQPSGNFSAVPPLEIPPE
ncbi:MAG: general secretion pathway protein GspK [Planctomycetaceae bacterium]|jgi:DNA uptake protein ComE-like DNA-binding protein|nr:general secretion pathway protein GspK [Planctomycetaceae bacterium]